MSSGDLADRLSLTWAAHLGALDSLECPGCHKSAVSVRFTHPTEHLYRTWFVCSQCKFEMRVQNTGRPPHYSDQRVDKRLQARDADILATRRLKPERDG